LDFRRLGCYSFYRGIPSEPRADSQGERELLTKGRMMRPGPGWKEPMEGAEQTSAEHLLCAGHCAMKLSIQPLS
jgi:hypothetical protein